MGRPQVELRGFGPFREARLELKPLTVIIGRNSSGKSLLLHLLWALITTTPFETLPERVLAQDVIDKANKTLEAIKKGELPREMFRELLSAFIDALPEALARALADRLEKVYGAGLGELVSQGVDKAEILVSGPRAFVSFKISAKTLKATGYKANKEFLEKIKVTVPAPKMLKIEHSATGRIYSGVVDNPLELVKALLLTVIRYIIDSFLPFFSAPEQMTALMPDSRAGVSRLLLKPYTSPRLIRGMPLADEEFITTYFKLAEALADGAVDAESLNMLLGELGCKVKTVAVGGVYTVRLEMWTGVEVDLPRAPSGIREALAVALALTAHEEPYVVLVEEPEAHLHPRAQRVLSRLIARAVNRGKTVVVTTHSDTLLAAINNLVMLSQKPEKARERGYTEEDLLDPGNVAAYLAKPTREGVAVLEQLEVTEEGIPEDEFTKILEELAEERAEALA